MKPFIADTAVAIIAVIVAIVVVAIGMREIERIRDKEDGLVEAKAK